MGLREVVVCLTGLTCGASATNYIVERFLTLVSRKLLQTFKRTYTISHKEQRELNPRHAEQQLNGANRTVKFITMLTKLGIIFRL